MIRRLHQHHAAPNTLSREPEASAPLRRLLYVVLMAVLVPTDALTASADETELPYHKGATRQDTYEATLQAGELPVFGPWSQVAPFDPILRRPQPPEETPTAESYHLLGGGTAGWRSRPGYLDGYANTFVTDRIPQKLLDRKPTVCLKRIVTAQRPQKIRVYLGCDAGFILRLNGRPLLYAGTLDRLEAGQESVVLPLQKGHNVLVLKVHLTRTPCRFFFMPEFGDGFNEQLLAHLERDFPSGRQPLTGYRERAAQQSSTAEGRYYEVTEIPTPPGVVIEGGGMDFLPDGRLAVSTRRGFVYLIEHPDAPLSPYSVGNAVSGVPHSAPRRPNATAGIPDDSQATVRFHRFAAGLQEPLGLKVVDGQIVVVQKCELTRLLDTDADGTADRFENLCNEWGLSGNYHEYAYGLVQDAQHNLYIPLNIAFPKGGPASPAPYRGWLIRVTPQGKMEPFCYGFRSPNGIGTNAAGDIFVTDNQGEWIPACPLIHVRKGHFYGHPVSIRWTEQALAEHFVPDAQYHPKRTRTLPAVWFPYDELAQSATDIICDQTGGRFGPFEGQLFVGEMTKGLIARVQLEKVNGDYQGACFLFRRGCGAVNRMTFGPNGHLYLSRCNRGWGGGGLGDGLARVEFTGVTPLEIQTVHLVTLPSPSGRGAGGEGKQHGFELTFTKPLAEHAGNSPKNYDLQQYGYHYWKTYGSPKIDLERIPVQSVEVSADRKTVRLLTGNLKAGKVCQFVLKDITAADATPLLHAEAWYTLNQFPE